MGKRCRFNPQKDKPWGMMIFSRILIVIAAIAIFHSFAAWGHAQSAGQSPTARQAYDRCQEQYDAMELRNAIGRPRSTDNLKKKYDECLALYTRLASSTGSSQAQSAGQSPTARQAYDRCQEQYDAMELRNAIGRPRSTDNLKKKYDECLALYTRLASSTGSSQAQSAGQSPTARQAYDRCQEQYDAMELRNAIGRPRSTDNLNKKYDECVALYNQLAGAQAQELKGTGVEVTVRLTRAGSNEAVNGWAQLGAVGLTGSSSLTFRDIAPGTYTVKGGATGYKDKSVQLTARGENTSTTLQLEPSANFAQVAFHLLDSTKRRYISNGTVTIGRETSQGREPTFELVEDQTYIYRATAPGYMEQSGSLQVGKAKDWVNTVQEIYLKPMPLGGSDPSPFVGTWTQPFHGGVATMTIKADGSGTLTALGTERTTTIVSRETPNKEDGTISGCVVEGQALKCSWKSTYSDGDKTITRGGALDCTLSGDTLTVTGTVDKATIVPKWNIPEAQRYPAAALKGGTSTYTRAK